MAGILGGGTSVPGPSLAPRIQSSTQGRAHNIGAGLNRVAGNLIDIDDFKATPASSGGKGAGGSGKGTSGQYAYSVSFIVSIGETVSQINTVFNGNQIDFLVAPSAQVLADLAALGITPTYGNTYGITFLTGSYTQTAWSYWTSKHPAKALAYRGEALACLANLGLGSSPTMPNFSFEVLWALNSDIPALGPDANPADWVTAFLTNSDWGVGFPSQLLGDMTAYQTWCRATGMMISPVLTTQSLAHSHLQEVMKGTVADFRWSNGLLTVVPYGDAAVTGNGYTFTPATTPIYNILPSDYLDNRGSLGSASGTSPVAVSRKDPAQVYNRVQVEYLDRSNLYNPVVIYDSDDVSFAASKRLRLSDLRHHHFFCLGSAASMSASLQMHREKVVTTYQFTLPATFILVDVLDILTLTEPNLGLNAQPVRVIEIVENADHSLTFTAEEFLGTVSAPLYARQMSLGTARNANVDPGLINTPLIIEPPDQLAGGLYIYVAVSGQNLALWGGCNVWASYSASGTYDQVDVIQGASRMGVTTATLPTIAAALTGQTIDNTNTLSVDLTESGGQLTSGLLADMTGLNTACYVDGEIIAYQNATLTAANKYNLAPMVRGAYGTTIASHASGGQFARLDGMILKIPFTQDRIGSTIYLKFQSFNIYGGGLQSLSALSAYSYVIKGSALASPLPNIQNLRPKFVDGVSYIDFDEISDFRPISYEIRRGTSWATGNSLGTIAHPPFAVRGDDTYWVAAKSQPVAGLTVYSGTPQSITVAGSIIVRNSIPSYDEAGGGWAGGTITGPGAISSGNFVTTATGTVTYWEPPAGHQYDVGFTREVLFNITSKAVGVPTNADFLGNPDFLHTQDFLSSQSSQFIDFWVEVMSGVLNPDVFAGGDVFAPSDVFQGSVVYGSWHKHTPGKYLGEFFKWRFALITYDVNTVATAIGFQTAGSVDARVDHIVGQSMTVGTPLTITFTPDAWSVAVPFRGGPNGASVPLVTPNIRNMAAGDSFAVTAISLTSMTIQISNGTTGGARTVDLAITGW